MTKRVRVSDLHTFDVTEHLDSEQAIAQYLAIVLEENDPSALVEALGDAARAHGMTTVAAASGITREALYRALRPGAQPRFDTVQRVCSALGLRLTVTPATPTP
jgi:probable addiction module antidote protein